MTFLKRQKPTSKQRDKLSSSQFRRSPEFNKPNSPATFNYYTGRPLSKTSARSSRSANDGSVINNTKLESSKLKKSVRKNFITSFRKGNTAMYIVGCVLVLSLVYSLMLSSDPRIIIARNTGNTLIRSDSEYGEGLKTVWNGSLLNKSKIFIDTESIENELKTKFSDIGEVRISLPLLGRQATVLIAPKDPVMVFETPLKQQYYIDKDGYVLSKIDESNIAEIKQGIPVLMDENNVDVQTGDRILNRQQINFIDSLSKGFTQKNLSVASFYLPSQSVNQVNIKFNDKKYYAKFAMNADAGESIGSLIAIFNQIEQGSITPPTEYIDNRVAGKIFLK